MLTESEESGRAFEQVWYMSNPTDAYLEAQRWFRLGYDRARQERSSSVPEKES